MINTEFNFTHFCLNCFKILLKCTRNEELWIHMGLVLYTSSNFLKYKSLLGVCKGPSRAYLREKHVTLYMFSTSNHLFFNQAIVTAVCVVSRLTPLTAW